MSDGATRIFALSDAETESWNRNGYLVREGVFTDTENDALRQVAEETPG